MELIMPIKEQAKELIKFLFPIIKFFLKENLKVKQIMEMIIFKEKVQDLKNLDWKVSWKLEGNLKVIQVMELISYLKVLDKGYK